MNGELTLKVGKKIPFANTIPYSMYKPPQLCTPIVKLD